MNFANGMKDVIANLDNILAVPKLLDKETMSMIERVHHMDSDLTDKNISTMNNVTANIEEIAAVSHGLSSIDKVLGIQNQIQYVSDIRDSIGLVAGNTKDVKAVAEDLEYIRASTLMEPMIKEVLDLSTKIDLVLDMEEDIKRFMVEIDLLDDKISRMQDLVVQAKDASIMSVNMVNRSNIIEKRIDEKLKRVEEIHKSISEFSIDVEHVGSSDSATSFYDKKTNTLALSIPRGIQGVKGEYQGKQGMAGRDGKDFSPTVMGPKSEMPKYGNRPMGTSYLSLDELPTMIYFRKSNTPNDWTKGQPFGSTEGLMSGSAENADRLNGYTAQDLLEFIQKKIGERDGV